MNAQHGTRPGARARRLTALAAVALAAALLAPHAARAQGAPPDTALKSWVRSMSDSTAEYFGLSAQPPDTAGLDSALEEGLAKPPGSRNVFRTGRRLALSAAPIFEFNRAVGAAYGASGALAYGHDLGRLRGSLQWANGPDDWYGTGGYAIRRADFDDEERAWSFEVDAGRRFESLNRDHYSAFFTFVDAFVYGTDRHSYLRRDGVRTSARVSTTGRWAELGYRNELESPLVTTATWNLLGRRLTLEPNAPAAFGRASEVRLAAGAQVPGTPLEASVTAWNAGGALGGDLGYHRYLAALGGGFGLGPHLAFTPQVEYSRLTGAALPQDALYLGGSYSLLTVEPQSLAGTGRAVARVELMTLDGVQRLVGWKEDSAFPIQLGAFAGLAARWGYDPATGVPRVTPRDWPGSEQWMSEAGVSVMFRPGLPDPESYLRIDYAWPLGPNDREAKLYLSWKRTLYLLGRH